MVIMIFHEQTELFRKYKNNGMREREKEREREREGDINFSFGKTVLLSLLIFCINPGLCLYLLVFANTWNVCFSVKFQPSLERSGAGQQKKRCEEIIPRGIIHIISSGF